MSRESESHLKGTIMEPTSRRHFFYSAGMALSALQATRVMGANERVHVAVIGLGGRGKAHMNAYSQLPEAQIVALCDVDQAALERGQALVEKNIQSKPKGYADMLDVFADKNVDAVSMPLPNHWHALATIRACQAGKDVYVEKPACHNVFEGQRMIDAARKYNRMVQIGSQSRSTAHKMKAMQLLHEGVIGKVYLAKGLCFKRRKSIGHKPDSQVPPGVDWDKFLGPAPMRAFNELRFKYNWHWFWDTGNGDIGNQGIHEMDIARWGLGKPGLPKSVVSTGGKYIYQDDQETPNTQIATFDYGDAELMFEVRGILTGSEGGLAGNRTSANVIGDLFYGADGWMAVDGAGFQVYKGEKGEKVMEEKAGDKDQPHFQNFLKAVKSRNQKELNADVAVGVMSANLVHLANASYRVGRKLAFDEKTLSFPADKEATALLTRKYRAPYIVPEKV
jgi:predicted dehydrogenase